MPTNLVPRHQPPAKNRHENLGLRVWASVLIPMQPFLLHGIPVGMLVQEPGLTMLCIMLLVSTCVWVAVLAIIHGGLRLLVPMYIATWVGILHFIVQPRLLQRFLVSAVFYVLPAALRILATVPLILIGMGSEAYANKVIQRYWEKEMTHFANHQQRLQRMGLAP